MVATLWLLSLLTITLITASECVYAPPPLAKYRRLDNTPFGFRDDFMLEKRTKPSLSIVNPLDVLRQRLLLEIARRQMRENSKQVEINRAILKNVGKRSSGDERHNGIERFEPFQQHSDLNAILNRIAEAQLNDRPSYNIPSSDYYFDDTNAIDTKQTVPSRLRFFRTSTSRLNNDFDAQAGDPFAAAGPDENAWHEEKLQKQQALNGHKSRFLRDWNQQINEKTDPAQQQQQQQQHQKQPLDNNGDFMQSLDLN
ncbi:uncharacterized protein LOC129572442 isoform X2 [Sitodiplosis mosellana]|nr:uncharacterized protein LOC129572442 isoform X2 [Sitodiplosis mosellana]XP_055308398.1 uncharacterized protein LOC129572442 isoform X2 [Sitodiplosis mosellana]